MIVAYFKCIDLFFSNSIVQKCTNNLCHNGNGGLIDVYGRNITIQFTHEDKSMKQILHLICTEGYFNNIMSLTLYDSNKY